ncbi:MAG: hypothetical protein AB8I08_38080 [Sandaracinaceae bacterium]
MELLQNVVGLLMFGSVLGMALCLVLAARNQLDTPPPKGALPLDDRTLTKKGQAFKQGAMLFVTVFVLGFLAMMVMTAIAPRAAESPQTPNEEPIDVG